MTSTTISGFSSISEGAAVAAAIGKAHSGLGGDDSHGFHLIVLSVLKGEGGWQALALVVTDPELESILHRRLRKEHEREDTYDRTHPKRKGRYKGDHQDNVHLPPSDDEDNKDVTLDHYFLHDDIFVYVPASHENLLETLEPVATEFSEKYDQDIHFHFIEEGSSLWENVQEMTPDYDFHKAVLMDENLTQSAHVENRTINVPEEKPNNHPKKKPILEELKDEA